MLIVVRKITKIQNWERSFKNYLNNYKKIKVL